MVSGHPSVWELKVGPSCCAATMSFSLSSSNTEIMSLCKHWVVDLKFFFLQEGANVLDTSRNVQSRRLSFFRVTVGSMSSTHCLLCLRRGPNVLDASTMFKVAGFVFWARSGCCFTVALLLSSECLRRGPLSLWYPPNVYLLLNPLFGPHIGRQSLSPILLLSWF